jgi:hypothetical protein
MEVWAILFIEFIILFITSRFLFKSIFALLYFLFRSQKVAIFLLSVFFFPGVFIHEMAHMVIAELLQVKTYGVEFIPELTGTSLKMGSVKVDRSDIIRRLLIGIAPLIVGSAILAVSLLIVSHVFSYSQIFSSPYSVLITIGIGLVIFVISNTMFSSKKDVEGLIEVLVVVAIITGALYFTGFRPHEILLSIMLQAKVVGVIEKIMWLLGIPVGINVVVVIFSLPLMRKLHFI